MAFRQIMYSAVFDVYHCIFAWKNQCASSTASFVVWANTLVVALNGHKSGILRPGICEKVIVPLRICKAVVYSSFGIASKFTIDRVEQDCLLHIFAVWSRDSAACSH